MFVMGWVRVAAGVLPCPGTMFFMVGRCYLRDLVHLRAPPLGYSWQGVEFPPPFHRDVLLPSQTPWSGRREAQQERAEENGGRIWDLGFDLGDTHDQVVLGELDPVGGEFHRHLMDATPLGVDGRLDGVSGTLGARHC